MSDESRPCAHLECALHWTKSGKVPSEFKCLRATDESGQYVVTVTLTVKAESSDDAVKIVQDRMESYLQSWFNSDASMLAPFRRGSLLLWNISSEPHK